MNRFCALISATALCITLLTSCGGGGGGGGGEGTARTAPAAPTDLLVSSSTSTRIILSWTDNSNNETGFRLEKRDAGSADFAVLATLSENSTTYTDTGNTPNITYYYRVLAYNAAGESSYSNMVSDTTPLLGLVTPLYVSAPKWNDYVRSADTGVICDGTESGGYTACIHGGEMRVVEVLGKPSCDGLTATDALGAFEWTCDAAAGMARFVSQGLKNGKNLSDLLDFETLAWKANSVTVNDGATVYGSTPSTVWWTNPVVVDNDGGSLDRAGTVYLVTANPARSYVMNASSLALVLKPGLIVRGPGAGTSIVSADGSGTPRNFLWFEGSVDATGDDLGVYWKGVKFSVLRNVEAANANTGLNRTGIKLLNSFNNLASAVTASNNYFIGINLDSSSYNTLTGASAAQGGSLATGVNLYGSSHNVLSGVTASGNLYGVDLSTSSSYNTLSGVTVANNTDSGVRILFSTYNNVSGVTAENNATYGVNLVNDANYNTLSGLSAWGNYIGIALSVSSKNNALSDVTVSNNRLAGVSMSSSSGNMLSGISASGNGSYGIYLGFSSSGNILSRVTAANNSSTGVLIESSSGNTLSEIAASNNAGGGIKLASSYNNVLRNVIASNNELQGVFLSSSGSNALLGITAANNYWGLYLDNNSNNNVLSGAAAANNGEGVRLVQSNANTLSGIAAANNYNYGVYLQLCNNNNFTGLLKVGYGELANQNCYVDGGTNPGLDDDNTPSDVTNDITHAGLCIQQGGSTFGAATTGITLASSFVAKATSDDVNNASDGLNGAAPGTALFGDITDWTNFDNSCRGWGRDGGAFPDGLNRVRCSTGTCRIWDWSLLASDTVLKSMLALPTGGNSLTIRWYSPFGATNQTDCDATRPGSKFSTVVGNHCESAFLLNAVELIGDGIGNDNGLCESGETCLYTPNIGAYQGHGNLVTAGPFTDGTVTGVTLFKYDTNGY